jgi:hypothetical protein
MAIVWIVLTVIAVWVVVSALIGGTVGSALRVAEREDLARRGASVPVPRSSREDAPVPSGDAR